MVYLQVNIFKLKSENVIPMHLLVRTKLPLSGAVPLFK